jgi:SagB-type dehydrogenase family enzyme
MEPYKTNRRYLKFDRLEEWNSHETDQKKGMPLPASQKSFPRDATLSDLVAPENLTIGQMPLVEVIRRRRSRREFTEAPLTLEELSFLLWATQGVDQDATRAFREWLAGVIGVPAKEITAVLRTVPSAGACNPFETYLVVNHVDELAPGLYRYLPAQHKLLQLQSGTATVEKARGAFVQWLEKSAVVFVWATVPYRTEWRYSILAHKMIAQEIGHVCQNLYLSGETIGAGVCAVMYDQAAADALLGVDGEDEFVISVAIVGKVT